MEESRSEVTVLPAEAEVPMHLSGTRQTWPEVGANLGLQGLSIALLLTLWYLVSLLVTADVVPTPLQTWHAFRRALEDQYVWSDIGLTLKRTLGAFGLAMTIGIIGGASLGTFPLFRRTFSLWLFIAASIPSLLYLVVIYLMLGLNDTAAIVGASLVVAPSIALNVWQGMKTLDPKFAEMARAFGMPRWMMFRRVVLPQTIPFLFAAARIGLALTWKIVIFVELLGRSSGVGYRIQYWYQLFNMERVLAAALPFIGLMLLIEFGVLRTLEAYLFRWRRDEVR